MRKRRVLLALCLAAVVLLFGTLGAPDAYAVIYTGSADGTVPWTLDTDTGELVIGNAGNTYTFNNLGIGLRTADSYGWNTYRTDIRSVRFEGNVVGQGSMAEMFLNCTNLVTADLRNFDTTLVTSFAGMFEGCTSLSSVILTGLSAPNLQQMDYMFSGCSSLGSVDLSGLGPTGTVSMTYTFHACSSLTNVQLGSLSADNYSFLFANNTSITSLDLSGLNLAGAVQTNMYQGMTNLQTLVLGANGTMQTDCGFDSLPGQWSINDSLPYTSSQVLATYGGGAATIQRGYYIAYLCADSSPADWVLYANGASYTLPNYTEDNPPNQSFYIWEEEYNEGLYAPGDAFDLTSAALNDGTDIFTIMAVFKYDPVTWNWGADGDSASMSYRDLLDEQQIAPATSISTLSDTRTCLPGGGITRRASVSLLDPGGNEVPITYTDQKYFSGTAPHTLSPVAASAPTCTEDGNYDHYHCSVCGKNFSDDDGMIEMDTVTLDALGHVWGTATYVWTADNSSETGTHTCSRCGVTESQTVAATARISRPATCVRVGETTFTAVFTDDGFVTQTKALENIPMGPHKYDEEWHTGDLGHWHLCTECGAAGPVEDHVPVGADSVEHPETCEICGYEIKPAKIVRSLVGFDETGSLALSTLTFTKTLDDEDDWTIRLPETAPEEEHFFFEGWSLSSDGELHSPGERFFFTYARTPSISVKGVWTLILESGESYDLNTGERYRLGSGRFRVSGDSTIYPGEQPVYPVFGGNFSVFAAG